MITLWKLDNCKSTEVILTLTNLTPYVGKIVRLIGNYNDCYTVTQIAKDYVLDEDLKNVIIDNSEIYDTCIECINDGPNIPNLPTYTVARAASLGGYYEFNGPQTKLVQTTETFDDNDVIGPNPTGGLDIYTPLPFDFISEPSLVYTINTAYNVDNTIVNSGITHIFFVNMSTSNLEVDDNKIHKFTNPTDFTTVMDSNQLFTVLKSCYSLTTDLVSEDLTAQTYDIITFDNMNTNNLNVVLNNDFFITIFNNTFMIDKLNELLTVGSPVIRIHNNVVHNYLQANNFNTDTYLLGVKLTQ